MERSLNNLPHYKVWMGDKKVLSMNEGIVTYGTHIIQWEDKGKKIQKPVRFTLVYENQEKGCRLALHQASIVDSQYLIKNRLY